MLLNLPLEGIVPGADYDLVCLSHLRWGSTHQRPQHLLTRFAKHGRVFYIEEPLHDDVPPYLDLDIQGNVVVVTPRVPRDLAPKASEEAVREMIDHLFVFESIGRFVLWCDAPKLLSVTQHLSPLSVIHDGMDDLLPLMGTPAERLSYEPRLSPTAAGVESAG